MEPTDLDSKSFIFSGKRDIKQNLKLRYQNYIVFVNTRKALSEACKAVMQIPGTVGSYCSNSIPRYDRYLDWPICSKSYPGSMPYQNRDLKMKLEVKKAVPNSGKLDAFLSVGDLNIEVNKSANKFSNFFTK